MQNYPFSQVVDSTGKDGQTVNQTLPLLENGVGPANGLTVGFSASVDAPQKGPCILALQCGPFQSYTLPENMEQLWGPIPLPRLPEDVPNTCIVASHRYANSNYYKQKSNLVILQQTYTATILLNKVCLFLLAIPSWFHSLDYSIMHSNSSLHVVLSTRFP